MDNTLITRIATLIIILIAFVDGFLVAERLAEKNTSSATETPEFDEIFDLEVYEEPITNEPEPEQPNEPETIYPFTSQAPLGDWKEPWSDYGEEAAALMAYKWATQEEIGSARQASNTLLAMGRWELARFQTSKETTASQTLELLTNYFGYQSASLLENPSLQDLTQLLNNGQIAILPVNGRTLGSPYYGNPAPLHHNLLLIGHDPQTQEFIVHDPGTRRGAYYRFPQQKILDSIQDLDGSRLVVLVSN